MYYFCWYLCNKDVICIFIIFFYDFVVFLKVKFVENFILIDDKDMKVLYEFFDFFFGFFNIIVFGGNDMVVVCFVGFVLFYFKELL